MLRVNARFYKVTKRLCQLKSLICPNSYDGLEVVSKISIFTTFRDSQL